MVVDETEDAAAIDLIDLVLPNFTQLYSEEM